MSLLPAFAFKPTYDLTTPLYTARGAEFDWQLGDRANSITLEWLADGGCWAGAIEFVVTPEVAIQWIENGLGLHVEVWNVYGQVIWDGFVDTLDFTMGNLSAKFGPLSDIANQIGVTYTPILDDTISPILVGAETETTLATDSSSQAKYGVWERWYPAEPGQTYQAQAEAQRDRYLAELAWPKNAQDIDFLASNNTTIKLGLLGYYHRFKSYVYENASTSTVTASTKVTDVIDADPNGMFSSGNATIDTNAFLVHDEERENRSAQSILSEIVSFGAAATDDRFVLGVYPGRHVKYEQIPGIDSPFYQRFIRQNSASVQTYGVGATVLPWDIKPAEWLYQPDIVVGKMPAVVPSTSDLRYMFIESVSYSTPYSVKVSGEQQSTLAQMMAKAQMEL